MVNDSLAFHYCKATTFLVCVTSSVFFFSLFVRHHFFFLFWAKYDADRSRVLSTRFPGLFMCYPRKAWLIFLKIMHLKKKVLLKKMFRHAAAWSSEFITQIKQLFLNKWQNKTFLFVKWYIFSNSTSKLCILN